MKPRMTVLLYANLLLQLYVIATTKMCFCSGSSYVGCIQSQRQALLRFKQDLKDPSNRLVSWTDDGDCCTWDGVVCNNLTGHVLELHLGTPCSMEFITVSSSYEEFFMTTPENAEYRACWRSRLVGKISPSLLEFKHLIYLDLSGNDFYGTEIPKFLGSMGNLRYLNLSDVGLAGKIPHQLGNLSNLKYLDLDSSSVGQLYVENLGWLSGLSFLEHLNLNGVNLSKASDWLLVTNSLSSLKVLKLSYCELQHFPSLPIANFSSLAVLSLSFNQFVHPLIPSWVFGLSHLVFFDICNNNFFLGPIPDGLQNCTSLRHLDLSYNYFNSSIPNWFSKFTCLEYLDLSFNSLQITISGTLLNQTSLKSLDLSFNNIEQKIPRSFGRLCNLRSIHLSGTGLSQEIEEILDILSACISDELESLGLSDNLLFGPFTNQLGQFKSLHSLFLSNNSISGPIPVSLGELSSLRYLDLSHNKLNGTLSKIHFTNLTRLLVFFVNNNLLTLKVSYDWVPPFQLEGLRLGSCYIGTRFPSWILSQKHLNELDLSNSGIVDIIPSRFWNFSSQINSLNLSKNQIHGDIPDLGESQQLFTLDLSSNNLSGRLPLISSSLGILDLSNNAFLGSIFRFLCYEIKESKQLLILKLKRNLLSGELPDCWMNWQNLIVLNLDKNKFFGNLPNSLGTLSFLFSLHLRKNRLTGAIPMELKNCTRLEGLDIGENEFLGNIPTWIGEGFLRMKILNFRSNKFFGSLPTELCSLSSLQILDVSYNNLSGWIPRCINNLSAMVTIGHVSNEIYYFGIGEADFIEEELLMMKGKGFQYNSNLNLVRFVDLSNNKFSGEIPMEVTHLVALQSLNLSFNFFIGKIPENIGGMTSLESLDFSANQLSGEIPGSISSLTFLSHLNLSNNNLIGKIPSSTQLQSLDASCFMGNELCGSPLPQNCTMTIPIPNRKIGDGNEHEVDWFFVSMSLGFVVGFWGLIGPLVVNRRWRYMYYHLLDLLGEKFGSVVRKCI